ncbi:hypothetical protein L5876_12265 [Hyphobacterium sp. SN044]|uniref:hypothetical protein n=1 Tax=Hyphobacterium sp. SN044 TaxID=2912575 RepID=UPI001F3F79AF|nr:hypothetical protein [Hyphobacterium sp. SN044]MCF8880592.1 hypothetical protein [Hyphobacterium sp. SN044]
MRSLVSIFGAAAVAFVLAGCGGSDDPAEDAPEAVNGQMDYQDGDDAAQDDEDAGNDVASSGGDEPMTSAGTDPEFIEGCLQSTNLSRETCICVAASAREELSEDVQDFLVASMNQRAEEATEIRMRLTIEEVTSAAMFMTNETRECVERGFN